MPSSDVTFTHLHKDVTLLGLLVVLVRKHLDDERMIKRGMELADRSRKLDQFSLFGIRQAAQKGDLRFVVRVSAGLV
jgi:hypothetical protein